MENGPKNPTKVEGFKLRIEIVMPPAPTSKVKEPEENAQQKIAKHVNESAKKVEK